jgi:AMP phosphorylase
MALTLSVKPIEMESGYNLVLLHERDAEELGVYVGDRVRLSSPSSSLVAAVNLTGEMVGRGEVGTLLEVSRRMGLKAGDRVTVSPLPPPVSVEAIRKKMEGKRLTGEEIGEIVRDIVQNNLTPTEISAFVVAEYTRGMSMEEIVSLTLQMVETGERLRLERGPVVDVHSIGGVPGNKYALVTVPIAVAGGLTVPKTSSRAITSAAGTADVMEVLANVSFSLGEIKEIVERVGGVIVWGGSVSLAPADDLLIRTERVLRIDPPCQMLASVMAKKLAEGVEHLLIDLPTGPGAKVREAEEARSLAQDFMELGRRLRVRVEVALTYGGQPLGRAVGPALEAREALEALAGGGPNSLREKALSLAGVMLEMGGRAPLGRGREAAWELLRSGKAEEKMREMIEAQGGDPKVKPEDLPVGDKRATVEAPSDGYVTHIYNERITAIACAAGAPRSRGAGLRLFVKRGHKVNRGEKLFEIYAEHESKLEEALKVVSRSFPMRIEGMMLERLSDRPREW